MDDNAPAIRRVLRDLYAQRVTQDAVWRAAVSHDDWLVPVAYAANALGRKDLKRLVMFGNEIRHPDNVGLFYTDFDAANAVYVRGAALGPYEAGIRGVELFGRLPASLTQVSINEGGPDSERMLFVHLATAKLWAETVGFERRVADPTTPLDEVRDLLRRYDGYFVGIHKHNQSIATIRNYPGVANAALLFTAPDCLAAALERMGPSASGIETGQTVGDRVFSLLAGNAGVDGIVLNFAGPGSQAMFTLADLGLG